MVSDGLFHLHMKNISRRGDDGRVRSIVPKAAYNAGQNLRVEQEERRTSLLPRDDVFWAQLLVPDGAPDWAADREHLWNQVDAAAKRKDARLAKEITAAIVRDIPQEQWAALVTEFAAEYTELGQLVDVAIHEDGSLANPHVHFLMTVNQLGTDRFGKKITEVDQKRYLTAARTRWEALTNKYLKANGLSIRVDARSYKARGLSQQPTRHRGPNRAERAAWRQRARTNQSNIKESHMGERDNDDPRNWIKRNEDTVSVDRQELYGEQWHQTQNLVEQARYQPQSEPERVLRDAIKGAPPQLRFEIEKEILYQKMMQLAHKEQAERITLIEQHLDADSLREFHRFMEQQDRAPDYPHPERGPDDELRSPVELADARKRMMEDYERER